MAHQARPFIGINMDYVPAGKTGPAQVRLPVGYFDAIVAAGGLPLLLPPLDKPNEIDPLLDQLDGVVLVGGSDIDPRQHGWSLHKSIQPLAERRHKADSLLLARVLERQISLLAIGLGMQQLNVALGGTLYAHLPEDQPRALPHRDVPGEPHRHAVLIEPNTRMDEIYGGGELCVTSDHHQAVRQLGANLRVSAVAPDGVIEAIETVDPDWFCVGVQWHPEAESATALDRQLFESFVEACQRQSRRMGLAA
ncbi:MAG: gamma-glutamyl-gamma-aminobutyrate hydrolase family protein [Gemmataceae bacterium]